MNPQDTAYIPVPVSEKPQIEGLYTMIFPDGRFGRLHIFKNGKWTRHIIKYTHWLKPVKLSEITTSSQPVKSNEDILVKALEKISISRENANHIAAEALSSYRTSVKGEEHELINESLDFYWRHCVSQLEGNDLGDIERKNYEGLKNKLYSIINKSQS